MNSSKLIETSEVDDDTAEEIALREELLLQKRKRELHREQNKIDTELLKVKSTFDSVELNYEASVWLQCVLLSLYSYLLE